MNNKIIQFFRNNKIILNFCCIHIETLDEGNRELQFGNGSFHCKLCGLLGWRVSTFHWLGGRTRGKDSFSPVQMRMQNAI